MVEVNSESYSPFFVPLEKFTGMIKVYLSGNNTRVDTDEGSYSFCPGKTRLFINQEHFFLFDGLVGQTLRLGKYTNIARVDGQLFQSTEQCFEYLETVINARTDKEVNATIQTDSFEAKANYGYNVSVGVYDVRVGLPTNKVTNDYFVIDAMAFNDDGVIVVGDLWVIDSKQEVTFLWDGASWIPSVTLEAYVPHVTVRMSGAGLMDVSVVGATGVKWIMQDGNVYDSGVQVPSGDINRPKIVFSGTGWVKLYCDDFSIVEVDAHATPMCNSTIADFSDVTYSLILFGTPLVSGLIEDVKATSIFKLNANDLVEGDLSALSNVAYILNITNCSNISSNSSTENCSATAMQMYSNNFSQIELNNLITYNYNLANTNKTLNITDNTVPDTATIAMITEMTTNRGWTITYDQP